MEELEITVVRRAIVIPPKIDEEILNKTLGFDEYGEEERHSGPLGKYMKDHGLEIDGYKYPPAYVMAKYLSYLGYLVFNIDETNTIFMPEVITDWQRDWCLDNEDIIRQEKVAILSLESKVFMSYDEYNCPNEDLYLKFLQMLDKKLETNNIKKGR